MISPVHINTHVLCRVGFLSSSWIAGDVTVHTYKEMSSSVPSLPPTLNGLCPHP